MAHGELTARMAHKLSEEWGKKGYVVLYDHDSSSANVGKIASWFGEDYSREAQLSQIDIAIVETNSGKVSWLIEIEETNDKPKTFLGDVLGALLGEQLHFGGKHKLSVDERTTLIILGKSKTKHKKRIAYLLQKVTEIKSGLSTANSKIGSIVLDTFSDEKELSALLPSALDRALKEEL